MYQALKWSILLLTPVWGRCCRRGRATASARRWPVAAREHVADGLGREAWVHRPLLINALVEPQALSFRPGSTQHWPG
jgi:hypothetical protein